MPALGHVTLEFSTGGSGARGLPCRSPTPGAAISYRVSCINNSLGLPSMLPPPPVSGKWRRSWVPPCSLREPKRAARHAGSPCSEAAAGPAQASGSAGQPAPGQQEELGPAPGRSRPPPAAQAPRAAQDRPARAAGGIPAPRRPGPKAPGPGSTPRTPRPPLAGGARASPAEAQLGCGPAGQDACVLTDQPDSEHQLGVRRLCRSHLPPQSPPAGPAPTRTRPPPGPAPQAPPPSRLGSRAPRS